MTLDGRIVEYLENGKFICAFVFEDNGSRLLLLNQNSRELNLPQNRIVHFANAKVSTSPSREETFGILQHTSKKRTVLAESISLEEIWEIISEKPEDTFKVDFLASLYFGDNPTDDQCAAFLRSVIANRIYFKYKSGTIHVNSPETVEQIRAKQEKEKEQESFIARNTLALRRIWENSEPLQDWDDCQETLQILADYYLFSKEASRFDLARNLVKNSQLNGPHDIYHLNR